MKFHSQYRPPFLVVRPRVVLRQEKGRSILAVEAEAPMVGMQVRRETMVQAFGPASFKKTFSDRGIRTVFMEDGHTNRSVKAQLAIDMDHLVIRAGLPVFPRSLGEKLISDPKTPVYVGLEWQPVKDEVGVIGGICVHQVNEAKVLNVEIFTNAPAGRMFPTVPPEFDLSAADGVPLVYFLAASGPVIKVGFTESLRRRLSEHRRNSLSIDLLGFLRGDRLAESDIHARLARVALPRLRESFAPHPHTFLELQSIWSRSPVDHLSAEAMAFPDARSGCGADARAFSEFVGAL